MFKLLIGIIIVAVSAIVVFMVIDPNVSINSTGQNSIIIVDPTYTSIEEGYFSVTIEGEVAKPGNYVLKDGSLMSDLIDSAGGLTDYGDERTFFEDETVSSGSTYYIPSRYDTSNVCQLIESAKVNVNSASLEEMLNISAFTNSVASSIISHRVENGEFRTIEGLLDVYGIGNATYRKLRNYVILHE